MSIQEEGEKDKQGNSLETDITEEEFDIVPSNGAVAKTSPWKHVVSILIIVLVGTASFGLGRLSFYEKKTAPVTIETSVIEPRSEEVSGEVKGASVAIPTTITNKPPVAPAQAPTAGEEVVASRSGSKYHYPWCAGAKQIADKNKIVFQSFESARAAGYTPAANCKGLR
jgi:hypothetical protein